MAILEVALSTAGIKNLGTVESEKKKQKHHISEQFVNVARKTIEYCVVQIYI